MRNAVLDTRRLLALIAAVAVAVPAIANAQERKAAHVEANGVSYYYEIHGQGEPLLLHGGLGTTLAQPRPRL